MTPSRARGRPRSEECRDAVLAAAMELMREDDLRKASIDRIAQRSGVSKATIYKWWPNRTAVAIDAFLHQMMADASAPNTSPAASKPNANSTTTTSPNATNPRPSKPVWPTRPRAVFRPASSIGLWLTQSDLCYALSLSLWPPSVCLPVAGIPTGRPSRRRCFSGRGISMHATWMPCAGCSPTM
jgi:Bacterial regulatory proteins, tetR family